MLQIMWSQLPEHPIWTDGPEAAPRQEGARRPAGHVDSDSSGDSSSERAFPGIRLLFNVNQNLHE